MTMTMQNRSPLRSPLARTSAPTIALATLALAASLAAMPAAARTFKCTKNGVTVYQGMACDAQPAAATAGETKVRETALVGCFELPDRSPVRGANQPLIVRKQVSQEAGQLVILDTHTKQTAKLRTATPEELQSANSRFQAKVEEGLVLTDADVKSAPLPGLYRAGDRYFGAFATGNAPATRMDCSTW